MEWKGPRFFQELMETKPLIAEKMLELLKAADIDTESSTADLIGQMIDSSLKMGSHDYEKGQLKLMVRAFKEMRYAYRIFNMHKPTGRCVSIFGSSRTPQNHPDYAVAKEFGAAMASHGWVCMTGAADGIMRAGLEGVPKESSYGLSIRLPFESTTHALLAGDPKLINFRYFFTRKLMFLSQSDALVAFPGGVGTQDELFEALTLMQTGKANILPLVLLEAQNGTYWEEWEHYIDQQLLTNGWISEEDKYFYYRAPSVQEAVEHIVRFYKCYASSRYVQEILVIRLRTTLTAAQLEVLNAQFAPLVQQGKIYTTSPLPDEDDHLELPRIAFEHNRKHYGLLRKMIDTINNF